MLPALCWTIGAPGLPWAIMALILRSLAEIENDVPSPIIVRAADDVRLLVAGIPWRLKSV